MEGMSEASSSARSCCEILKVRVSVPVAAVALESSYSREKVTVTCPGAVSSAMVISDLRVMASPGVSLCT